jgi:hypothetical protein
VSITGVVKEKSYAKVLQTWLDGQRDYDPVSVSGMSKIFTDVIESNNENLSRLLKSLCGRSLEFRFMGLCFPERMLVK